jgi:lipopolysaccharide transport system permease protein
MFRSLFQIPLSLIRHRYLIRQLTWREIAGRYRGSAIGVLWSFITPLIMLTIYTLVFGSILGSRWSDGSGGANADQANFALVLFSGLILHGILAESLARAPGLILGNVNLVKRVMFPLEILGWSAVASSLFHGAVSFLVLLAMKLALHGSIPWQALLLPLVLAPFMLMVLGVVWFLSALGVFVRDVGQIVQPLATILLFLSPILFPANALPRFLRDWIVLNPLTIPVEQARALIIWGTLPDWGSWLAYCLAAVTVAWAGFYWFQRSRPAFADVL